MRVDFFMYGYSQIVIFNFLSMLSQLETMGLISSGFLCTFYRKYNYVRTKSVQWF